MQSIQIIILIFSVFALSRSLLRFKRKELRRAEVIFWIVLWIGVIIVALLPQMTGIFSWLLGSESGSGINVLIYLSILMLLYLVFRLYVRLEKTDQEITRLVREMAKK